MYDINGSYNNNIHGDVNHINGTVNGNIYGTVYGDINGSVNGNIKGSVYGRIYGQVNGNIQGSVAADKIYGSVNGRIGRIISENNSSEPTLSISFKFEQLLDWFTSIKIPNNTIKRTKTLKKRKIITVKIKESLESENIEPCCPICLDTIHEMKFKDKKVMTTICGHIFCSHCCDLLFKDNNEKAECPNCREALNKTQFHNLHI